MLFKMFAGKIFSVSETGATGAVGVEVMFVAVCVIAMMLALGLRRSSARMPELRLDSPSKK